MNASTIQGLLYNLFLSLVKEGVPLTIEQFKQFIDALANGYGQGIFSSYDEEKFSNIRERELWNLMATLWIMDYERYEATFEKHFKFFLRELSTLFELPVEGNDISENDGVTGPAPSNSNPSRPNDPPPPPPSDILPPEPQRRPVSEPTKTGVLTLDFISSTEKPVDGAVIGDKDNSDEYCIFEKEFNYRSAFVPFSERKMKRLWKYLKYKGNKVPSKNIDIYSTVQDWAKYEYFIELKYKYERLITNSFVFLIDKSISMMAFEELSVMLYDTFKDSFRIHHRQLKLQYFEYYLSQTILSDHFLQFLSSDTVVFIISDAGAARYDDNDAMIRENLKGVQRIQKKTKKVFWLNPVPKERWHWGAAFDLSFWVKMIPIEETTLRTFLKTSQLV